MYTTKRLVATMVAAVMSSGLPHLALGQEGGTDESPSYFFAELEGFLHPDLDNPFDCAIGFTSDTWVEGETELLGATTARHVNCYVPTDTLNNIQGAVFTITAESGDTLTGHGGGTGDCIPDDVPNAGDYYSCWGTVLITGGTGDFEGADGELHILVYTWNTQSDHPDAAPGDTPAMMLYEGLIEY